MIKTFVVQWVLLSIAWFLLRHHEFEWALFPLAFWIFYMIITVLNVKAEEFEGIIASGYAMLLISFVAILLFFISLRQIFYEPFMAFINYASLVTVAVCHCVFFYQVLQNKRK